MNRVIGGSYSPPNLRSPYADSLESLNPSIHAVAHNRSENQSTRLAASKIRTLRSNQAAEATETTRAPYEGLTP